MRMGTRSAAWRALVAVAVVLSTASGCTGSPGRGWVLAEVLVVTPVHAETAANTAAAGSQDFSRMKPSTPQRRIQLLSVRYPGP